MARMRLEVPAMIPFLPAKAAETAASMRHIFGGAVGRVVEYSNSFTADIYEGTPRLNTAPPLEITWQGVPRVIKFGSAALGAAERSLGAVDYLAKSFYSVASFGIGSAILLARNRNNKPLPPMTPEEMAERNARVMQKGSLATFDAGSSPAEVRGEATGILARSQSEAPAGKVTG